MLLLLFVLLISGSFVIPENPHSSIPQRPNILLVMCDDLGWGDVGFNGSTAVQTPQLDALAAQGVRLTRFYSGGAVCSPTRASCLTGRNSFRMGIPTANSGHMKPQEITLPELLREQGYTTGHFGKWHLGTLTTQLTDANRGKPRDYSHYSLPSANGYDTYFCTESKVPTWDPLLKPMLFDTAKGESLRYGWAALEAPDDPRGVTSFGTYYWKGPEQIELNNVEGDDARMILDRAIPFMRKAAQADRPFFATVWFHTPHLPVVAAQQYRDLYPDLSHELQLYYGTISAMDEQMGRLMAELEAMGVAENTIIWFCSDNGPERETPGSAGPFRDRKRSLYEGGVRVPAFCVWPGKIASGTEADYPLVTSDYLPTILDWLDISYPDADRPLDGISAKDLLAGTQTARKRPIGFQYPRGRVSWVTDRYKLLRDQAEAPWELFDLQADPGETRDLAAAYPAQVEAMKKDLLDWVASCRRSEAGEDY